VTGLVLLSATILDQEKPAPDDDDGAVDAELGATAGTEALAAKGAEAESLGAESLGAAATASGAVAPEGGDDDDGNTAVITGDDIGTAIEDEAAGVDCGCGCGCDREANASEVMPDGGARRNGPRRPP